MIEISNKIIKKEVELKEFYKVSIPFSNEKLKALHKFSKQKNMNLDTEILKFLEILYQKTVPKMIRDYIEGI
ncbi:MAG: DUF6103 family protein [Rickettsiales bacterium]|jgi:hypothetical protein|nr:DUF6103 family protein [Rickettsiales bacterium]MDR2830895.1 DUF6103 family protein [Candidatus Methanovirga basalitermitum]